MSETSTGPATSGAQHPLTRTAIGLAVASVVLWLALAATDHDGPLWLVWAVIGAATAVVAYRAGGTNPRNRAAFACFVIGVLAVLVFLGFVIFDL